MFRVSCTIAALLTGYSHRPVCATFAEIDAKLTIAPCPLALQVRVRRLGQRDAADDVHVERREPVRAARCEAVVQVRAREVDERVEAAEALDGVVDDGCDLVVMRDVGVPERRRARRARPRAPRPARRRCRRPRPPSRAGAAHARPPARSASSRP